MGKVQGRSTGEHEKMNISELERELTIDEGCVYEVYLCTENHKTAGIGHKLRPEEPEYHLDIGSTVSPARVQEWFAQDVFDAIAACKRLFDDFDMLPEEVQKIAVNMCFNLGPTGYSKFKKHITAINNHDWAEAAAQMQDSRWYHQVGDRSKRLVSRMRSLA